ncbi:MAG: O-antigen ligase family protein [Planctomycetes bacterium]|nr:O-antigen ligase family protein [Planctomycetota bacterium]
MAALIAVAMAGAALGLTLAGKAAVLPVLVLIFGLIGLSLVRDIEYIAFLTLAASIPIRLNMRLTEPMEYARAHSANGFIISLTDCLAIVLLVGWGRRILFYDQPIRWAPSITIPMLLLLGWVIAGAVQTVTDPISAVHMTLKYVECCLVLLYLINNIRPIQEYIRHSLVMCGILAFEVMLGLGQGATGGFNFGMEALGAPVKRSVERTGSRITGTIPTPNAFASILSTFILFPIILLFSQIRVRKIALTGLIVLTGFAMLGTKSRGVWLSSSIVFGYLIFALLRTRFSITRASFGVTWIVIILGVVAFITPGVTERLFADDFGSAESRTYMIQIATNMMEAKPWFGFGWDNYTLYFSAYDDTDIMHSEAFPFVVHNGWAYMAVEYGLPAAGLMILIWIIVLKRTLRLMPESWSFPAMAAFFLPWGLLARFIQTPLYVNQPLNDLSVFYLLGMCLVFRELADRDAERRAQKLPDPIVVAP